MGQSDKSTFSAATYFNPPIPCGMGRRAARANFGRDLFQSTHPVWDGTRPASFAAARGCISIHPSRVGWDTLSQSVRRCTLIFQSTHPVWDGTYHMASRVASRGDFNPPIPCGMGRRVADGGASDLTISIHPSRVGWDLRRLRSRAQLCISIHPSRVGWDSQLA